MPAENFNSPKWTPEEFARLEHLYTETDATVVAIAKMMGRSVKAIHNKRDFLGIPSRQELKQWPHTTPR